MTLSYSDFQITTNFNTKEFHCKSGIKVPHQYIANVVYVATQLQRIRWKLGNCTIYINSAYRTKQHNDSIGGVPKSNHLTASAVDIRTQKYTANELHSKLKTLINDGVIPKGELIRYATFVHYAPEYNLKFTSEIEPYF